MESVATGSSRKVSKNCIPMQPRLQSSSIRCFSSPVSYQTNSFRMPARESTLRKEDGFESKGVVLLLICGVYAIFLFILARLCSYVASRLMSSVKTVFVKKEVTEVTMATRLTKSQNPQSMISHKVREPTRSVCHG